MINSVNTNMFTSCLFNISIQMSHSHHKPNIFQMEFDLLVAQATCGDILDSSFPLISMSNPNSKFCLFDH